MSRRGRVLMPADPAASLARLRPARARVDLTRLRANYHAVAAAAGRPVMPVVKADAYGHGAAVVARVLEAAGAPMLAVALVEEGVALRRAGVGVPIVVLAGFAPGQVAELAAHALTPVVGTAATLEAVTGGGTSVPVHLEVDTGMTRLGFAPAQVVDAAVRVVAAPHLRLEGVMTHLACADEDRAATERQLDRFDAAIGALAGRGIYPRWIHAANSAGLAALRPGHTLARPGLLLYGVRPRPLAPAIEVRPVMTVSGDVARIAEVPPGASVSYGARWTAARPSRIATVALGYADGVPRTDAMREGGALLVRGRRAPVVGTVCMDLTMLDVTGHADAREGVEAVLFGDEPDAWEVADRAGTNAWQVLTALGPRVPRVYVEDGRVVGVEARGGAAEA